MYVTIGIPFYNAEKYLLDAIKSVFAQTHKKWELILIDDGSTDNSLAIAKSIKDPRVRVYSDGKNLKLAARLNQITELAKYDYIARMDADDLMSPTRIEKQLKILKDYPEIDLVSTGILSIDENLDIIGYRVPNYNYISFELLLEKKGTGIVHASILSKKEWYKRNRYDEILKIAQDYELWLRGSSKNDLNIFLIKEPLYYYREFNNVNLNKILNAYKNDRQVIKKYAKKHKLKFLIKSYIKTILVYILLKFGLNKFLLNQRINSEIPKSIVNTYNENLKQIKSQIFNKNE